MFPTIAYVILHVIAIKRRPKAYISLALFLSAVFILAQAFLQPSFDHRKFLPPADMGFWDALFSSVPRRAPAQSFYGIVASIIPIEGIYVPLANGLSMTAALIYIADLLFGRDAPFTFQRGLLVSCCLFLSPLFLLLGVGANKDYTVCVCLAATFAALRESVIRMPTRGFSAILRPAIKGGVLIVASLLALLCLRAYILAFVWTAVAIVLGYFSVVRLRQKWIHLPALVGLTAAAISTVLFIKWQSIRVLMGDFDHGNATLEALVQADSPGLTNSILYTLRGWGVTFVGIFAEAFNQSLTLPKFLTGLWEYSYTLVLFAVFMAKYKNRQIKGFVCVYLLLHFGIQIWGSPNLGTFLRLRIFEMMILVVYLGWSLRIRPVYGTGNNQLILSSKPVCG